MNARVNKLWSLKRNFGKSGAIQNKNLEQSAILNFYKNTHNLALKTQFLIENLQINTKLETEIRLFHTFAALPLLESNRTLQKHYVKRVQSMQ